MACSAGCRTSAPGPGSWRTSSLRAGTFYITEAHLIFNTFENEGVAPGELRLTYPYFEHQDLLVFDVTGSYADLSADVGEQKEHGWDHGLGEIVTAPSMPACGSSRSRSIRSSSGPRTSWSRAPGSGRFVLLPGRVSCR